MIKGQSFIIHAIKLVYVHPGGFSLGHKGRNFGMTSQEQFFHVGRIKYFCLILDSPQVCMYLDKFL